MFKCFVFFLVPLKVSCCDTLTIVCNQHFINNVNKSKADSLISVPSGIGALREWGSQNQAYFLNQVKLNALCSAAPFCWTWAASIHHLLVELVSDTLYPDCRRRLYWNTEHSQMSINQEETKESYWRWCTCSSLYTLSTLLVTWCHFKIM